MKRENPETTLTAGPWSAVLAPDGSLSRVSFGSEEILRGLSVVVRTNTWLTVVADTDLTVSTTDRGFTVDIAGRNRGPQVDFTWRGIIDCRADGEFRYQLSGVSHGVTSTNRTGLVALHSLNWAGHPVVVTHGDGSTTDTSYPELVSPHQPMKDIRAMTQSLPDGHCLTLSFSGEIFEMEDQRNWTDASFKTYSRPLEWPFPYELSDGETVTQEIVLTVAPSESSPRETPSAVGSGAPGRQGAVAISLDGHDRVFPWPHLGLGTDPTTPGMVSEDVLTRLSPDYLRVDVVVDEGGLHGADILSEVGQAGVPVELAIHVGQDPRAGLTALAETLKGITLSAVMVYDTLAPATTVRAVIAVRDALDGFVGGVAPLFVGTDDNFTELNRNRVVPGDLGAEGICFAPSPQIHDSTERAIIQTSEALPAVIKTARDFAPGAPIAISPLTFKARRNIHAPGRIIDRLGRDVDSVDSRWGGMFSAVWLATTLAAFVQGGVSRVTVGEIVGPRGVLGDLSDLTRTGSDLEALWQWLNAPRTRVHLPDTGASGVTVFADPDSPSGSLLVVNSADVERSVELRSASGVSAFPLPPLSFRRMDTP